MSAKFILILLPTNLLANTLTDYCVKTTTVMISAHKCVLVKLTIGCKMHLNLSVCPFGQVRLVTTPVDCSRLVTLAVVENIFLEEVLTADYYVNLST